VSLRVLRVFVMISGARGEQLLEIVAGSVSN
jgi:hypothetical protein